MNLALTHYPDCFSSYIYLNRHYQHAAMHEHFLIGLCVGCECVHCAQTRLGVM